jgi:hypothetical protein
MFKSLEKYKLCKYKMCAHYLNNEITILGIGNIGTCCDAAHDIVVGLLSPLLKNISKRKIIEITTIRTMQYCINRTAVSLPVLTFLAITFSREPSILQIESN